MTSTIDRRRFMQTAGVAAGAAGALWAAPAVLGTSTAFAGDSCVQKAQLNWSSIPTGGQYPFAPTNTSRTFTVAAVNTLGSHPAVNVIITVTRTGTVSAGQDANGNSSRGGVNASVPYPNNPGPVGLNGVTSYYVMNMQNAGSAGDGYTFQIEFRLASNNTPVTVHKLEYAVIDVDRSTSGNQYKDEIWISQSGGSPSFNGNKGSNVSGAGTNGNRWTSLNNSGVQDTTGLGTVDVTYTSPLSTTTLHYTGAEGRNGIQYVGIGDLAWCY